MTRSRAKQKAEISEDVPPKPPNLLTKSNEGSHTPHTTVELPINIDKGSHTPNNKFSERLKKQSKKFDYMSKDKEGLVDTWVSQSNSTLCESQWRDEELGPIMELLSHVPNSSLPDKFLGYFLDDGVLYFSEDSEGLEKGKIVVPKEHRHRLCCEYHSLPTGGHFGSRKTISAMKRHYFWPFMVKQIKNYCRTCAVCAARSGQQKRPKPKLTPLPIAEEPMDRVGMDVLKLPMSVNGNNHVLVLQDYLTKYLFTYPLANETAEEIGKLLVSRFFANFGLPRELLTDRGSAFISLLFHKLEELYKIK
ncbi:MAG: transposase family protein, partial [Gammaproteobacteria bacterium]|nr:transposase family protein [Gammaproteobacteria bacterium]